LDCPHVHHVKKLLYTVPRRRAGSQIWQHAARQFGGGKKGEARADLALIGAAQKVEHYEISAYATARKLGATAEDAWPITLASDVACRGAECRPVAQPGSTALDVLCAHAGTN
jgi:Domain of unknown function (DUF892)